MYEADVVEGDRLVEPGGVERDASAEGGLGEVGAAVELRLDERRAMFESCLTAVSALLELGSIEAREMVKGRPRERRPAEKAACPNIVASCQSTISSKLALR